MAIFNMENSSLNEFLSGGGVSASLNEADRTLKNERKIHSTHGPEDYSKFSNNDLKTEFDKRRTLSQNSKNRRSDESSYVNGSDYGTHNRRKAAAIGSELKRRGYDPKTGEKLREAAEYILSVLDEMDYLDESEKKSNELLNNDTFKNIIQDKIKERVKKGKTVSIDSLPDSDEKDTIKKRLNK